MGDREKLIELFHKMPNDKDLLSYDLCDVSEFAEDIADWLIANGVTIQRWLPVTERLPETSGYHVWVIACVDGKRSCVRMFERKMVRGKMVERFKYPWELISYENITHWCELPQPPKEDECESKHTKP